ncbi:M13 family metallopeptidase, partial [Salmonella enterica subsp. enterica serovar Soahanina]|nr:M13 family metallopeptidase [Salmonella enterica subsp. enterica serovar Soahanina]
FMDQAHLDALGAKPIAPQLDAVKQAATRDAQAALMGRTNSDFEGSLFNIGIDVDLKDINRYAVYVSQAGLGMPDRDYYL